MGNIGNLITKVILLAAFFLVLMPVGLTLRLFGIDYMKRKRRAEAQSYWESVD